MKNQIKLGQIFGIEIRLHFSWLIIAVLISFSLSHYFSTNHPDWSNLVIWSISILTAFFFFIALIIHELSHAAVAKKNNLPVREITLFALGGVARIEKEPADPGTEFKLGIIGPITSMVIGLLCLGISYVGGWKFLDEPETPLMAMFVWLGYVNIALAVFNMIPGFPMDGGRVLRSIIWKFTGDATRSTQIASLTGQFIAFSLIIFGLFLFFFGSGGIGGLWLVFIGWFLLNAAKATYVQVEIEAALKEKSVGDLMKRDCFQLSGRESLRTLVDDHFIKTGQRCFMVVDDGETVGMITPHEITKVERRLWDFKTVSDVMRPIEDLFVVTPDTPAVKALEIIGREGVSQLPVVSNGRLEGIITREQIINYLFLKKELNY